MQADVVPSQQLSRNQLRHQFEPCTLHGGHGSGAGAMRRSSAQSGSPGAMFTLEGVCMGMGICGNWPGEAGVQCTLGRKGAGVLHLYNIHNSGPKHLHFRIEPHKSLAWWLHQSLVFCCLCNTDSGCPGNLPQAQKRVLGAIVWRRCTARVGDKAPGLPHLAMFDVAPTQIRTTPHAEPVGMLSRNPSPPLPLLPPP